MQTSCLIHYYWDVLQTKGVQNNMPTTATNNAAASCFYQFLIACIMKTHRTMGQNPTALGVIPTQKTVKILYL